MKKVLYINSKISEYIKFISKNMFFNSRIAPGFKKYIISTIFI